MQESAAALADLFGGDVIIKIRPDGTSIKTFNTHKEIYGDGFFESGGKEWRDD